MNTSFIAPQHQAVLNSHSLNTFDALWDLQVDWFEEPNERRGGWSGVGRIELQNDGLAPSIFFVKKQQNHGRRTLLHPFRGEPTFRREFERLRFLQQHSFAAPEVVFYAESNAGGKQRAILVTVALTEYVPLDTLAEGWNKTASRASQLRLIKKVADEIRRFHDLGLVHRALYPKHIFVKNADGVPEIALIDLEKARSGGQFLSRAAFDLAALNRHATGWRVTQKMAFFLQYMKMKKLDSSSKQLCHSIIRRSRR